MQSSEKRFQASAHADTARTEDRVTWSISNRKIAEGNSEN
jgi:hypothetical protein